MRLHDYCLFKILQGCERWVNEQRQRVTTKNFTGVTHMGMVTGDDVTNYVAEIVKDLNQELVG